MASSPLCRADDPPAASPALPATDALPPLPDAAGKPAATDVDAVPGRHRRPAKHRTVAEGIDEGVRRMTRGLDLDASQQTQLRQILVDQYRQILAFRTGQSSAPPDMVGTPMAIYENTKTRIRAMLNEEQRKKYSVDVPHDQLAPTQADLEHWMGLQEAKRRQSPVGDQ